MSRLVNDFLCLFLFLLLYSVIYRESLFIVDCRNNNAIVGQDQRSCVHAATTHTHTHAILHYLFFHIQNSRSMDIIQLGNTSYDCQMKPSCSFLSFVSFFSSIYYSDSIVVVQWVRSEILCNHITFYICNQSGKKEKITEGYAVVGFSTRFLFNDFEIIITPVISRFFCFMTRKIII